MYWARSLVCRRGGGGLHMPSRIHPRIFAEHEYFGDPPGERRALAALFQFVEIRRIDDGDAAVALNFSSWERQAHPCRAAFREPRCARQGTAAVAQFLRSWIYHDRFFRDQFLQCGTIVREERSP